MNKFVPIAKKNLPTQSQGKQGLDEFLHSKKVFSDIKKVAPTIPTLDISVNAKEFKKNVQRLMDDEPLTNNFFVFSSRRQSEKIMLERDRLTSLLGVIDRVIETNRNIIRYNVDVFITQQMLERLALEHSVNLEKYARSVLREEELLVRLHADNLDKVDDEYKLRQATLRKAELENDRLAIEIEERRTRNDFIRDALSKVQLEKMPPSLQAYITATMLNPNGSQYNDFEMQEQLKEYIKQEAEAKAQGLKAEAKSKEYKAEHEKWKHERQRNRPEK
jgi:hypothetical protein